MLLVRSVFYELAFQFACHFLRITTLYIKFINRFLLKHCLVVIFL